MKKNRILSLCLAVALMLTMFAGFATVTSAALPVGSNLISKDFTFETQTIGSATSGIFGYGSAVSSALIIAGGANGTAKAINVPASWLVASAQETTNGMTAGHSYRFSAWIKGTSPYLFQLIVNTAASTSVTYKLTDHMTPTVNSTWQLYSMDFIAPAGAPYLGGGSSFFDLQTQSAGTDFQFDEVSVKEIDALGGTPTPTAVVTPTPTATPTVGPTADPNSKKIMCIGDSITQGTGGVGGIAPGHPIEYSWRYPLWKLLIDNNASFEFVGSRTNGFDSTPTYADYKGKTFSNRNEGYWGWTIQSVTTALTTTLTTITPDIAIIYLGTNNQVTNETVAAKVDAMKILIQKLRTANPKMKILLGEPSQTWFGEMQTAYKNLATELNTVDSPVIAIKPATPWVDNPTAANTCTNDWVHTNQLGDQTMANNILPVLAQVLGITIVTAPPTATPIAVTGISISKSSAALTVGKTLQLTATISPSNATSNGVVWSSSNSKVATVSTTGKVTAKGPGTATITVRNLTGAFTKTCKITVTQLVSSVKLNKSSVTVSKGKTYTLKATVAPSNASNKKVTWKSSNSKIATVSSTGKIKGIKKGTVTITVTTADGKKTAKCKVTVK